jgi:hypothetical protein
MMSHGEVWGGRPGIVCFVHPPRARLLYRGTDKVTFQHDWPPQRPTVWGPSCYLLNVCGLLVQHGGAPINDNRSAFC